MFDIMYSKMGEWVRWESGEFSDNQNFYTSERQLIFVCFQLSYDNVMQYVVYLPVLVNRLRKIYQLHYSGLAIYTVLYVQLMWNIGLIFTGSRTNTETVFN